MNNAVITERVSATGVVDAAVRHHRIAKFGPIKFGADSGSALQIGAFQIRRAEFSVR